MRSAFRWWLANAGNLSVAVGLLALVVFASGQVSAGWALGALAAASLVQGLRNLWAESLWKFVVLAIVVPVLLMASILLDAQAKADWSVLLFLAPAAATGITELAVRRWRVQHGLPPVAPPKPVVAPPPIAAGGTRSAALGRGCLKGCLVMLGLGLASVLALSWSMRVPTWNSEAFKAQLHPGMTLGEVAVAAWPHGRYLALVRGEADAPESPDLWIETGHARVGTERAEGEAATRALLDRSAPSLKVEAVSFVFLAIVPVRSTVVVRFGPDGRVTLIEGPFNHAD